MKQLQNSYQQQIEEQQLKATALQESINNKINQLTNRMTTAVQIGHDSRVDEAIMLTFLHKLLESIIVSALALKKMQEDKLLKQIQDKIKELENSKKKAYDVQKDMQDLNKYQVLNAKVSASTKELEENKSLTTLQKKSKEKEIQSLKEQMKDIEDNFSDQTISKELKDLVFESQTKVFNETTAQNLKDFRNFEGNTAATIKGAGLKADDIDEKVLNSLHLSSIQNMKDNIDKITATQTETTTTKQELK